MKAALLLLVLASTPALADQYVNGYVRSDGTYVQGHYRSDSNSTKYDNYSSQGNTNPYTGQRGSQGSEFSNPPSWNTNSNPYGNTYNYNYNRRSR